MKFNIDRSFDKTGSFLDSLITRKSLKLKDDISNQYCQLLYVDMFLHMSFVILTHSDISVLS